MTKSIHLAGIGQHTAIEAQDLKSGDTIVWNYGSSSTVDSAPVFSASRKTLTVTLNGGKYTRRFKASRLVGIVPPDHKEERAQAYRFGAEARRGSDGRITASCQCPRTMELIAEAGGNIPFGEADDSTYNRIDAIFKAFSKGFHNEGTK